MPVFKISVNPENKKKINIYGASGASEDIKLEPRNSYGKFM